jgi:hypothetical protein
MSGGVWWRDERFGMWCHGRSLGLGPNAQSADGHRFVGVLRYGRANAIMKRVRAQYIWRGWWGVKPLRPADGRARVVSFCRAEARVKPMMTVTFCQAKSETNRI